LTIYRDFMRNVFIDFERSQWRSQPKILFGAKKIWVVKIFEIWVVKILRELHKFVWDTASQSTK